MTPLTLLSKLKQEATSLRQGLVDTYEDQLRTFLVELDRKLNETIPGKKKQIEKALIHYAQEFPSIDDFSGFSPGDHRWPGPAHLPEEQTQS